MRVISALPPSVSRNLYWECYYNVLDYVPDLQEPTDSLLKEYKLPEKIEQFIEEKRYDNMERTVTKVCQWAWLEGGGRGWRLWVWLKGGGHGWRAYLEGDGCGWRVVGVAERRGWRASSLFGGCSGEWSV